MLLFLKSSLNSRRVKDHHDDDDDDDDDHKEEQKENEACTSLTVWRKSLLFSCEGFTVIGSDGNLVYRVDNYTKRPYEVILMDGSGKPILTIFRRKKLGLADNWVIYEGEVKDNCNTKTSKKQQPPMCCVRKHTTNILNTNLNNVLAYVYRGVSSDKRSYAYVIEGSYTHRSCKVYNESRQVVAEIKKKENTSGGVSFGLEVFVLIVRPGFDSGFAMAIILLLDQMFS